MDFILPNGAMGSQSIALALVNVCIQETVKHIQCVHFHTSLEAKIAKDSLTPSLGIIQVKCIASEKNAQSDFGWRLRLSDPEKIRLEEIWAQKRALEWNQDLHGWTGDFTSCKDSFFTESARLPSAEITGLAATARGDESPRPLSVGTDCSGMEAPIQALENMKIRHSHLFSCDNDAQVIKTINANFKPHKMYPNVQGRDNTQVPYVDLYVAGFPCQPFSTAGKQEGFDDIKGRGLIFFDVVDYITVKRPRIFILENVKGLVQMEHGKYLKKILKVLRSIGDDKSNVQGEKSLGGAYEIHHQILNTKDHGVPQSRPRWYCVGLRKDRTIKNADGQSIFHFPNELKSCPSINDFLDPPTHNPKKFENRSNTAHTNIEKARAKIRAEGQDPDKLPYVVDCDAPTKTSRHTFDYSPCITRSRNNGHWLTHRQRRMSKPEMFRLQGMDHSSFVVDVSDKVLGQQLGNAMSVNVIERVIRKAVMACSWHEDQLPDIMQDRWWNGTAQKKLLQSIGKEFCPKPESASSILARQLKRDEEEAQASTFIEPKPKSAITDFIDVPKDTRFTCHVMSSQGVRILIIDSGATYHLVDLDGISEEERSTMRELENPVPVLAAGGKEWLRYECDVWIHELQMTVTAMMLKGTPAVLSMGKLVKQNGFKVWWDHPSPLTLIKDDLRVLCWDNMDVPRLTPAVAMAEDAAVNPVQTVDTQSTPAAKEAAPEVPSNPSSSSISPAKAVEPAEQTEVTRPASTAAKAHAKAESKGKTAKEKADKVRANRKAKRKVIKCQTCEHNIFTHFPRDPNCQICQDNKIQRASRRQRAAADRRPDALPEAKEFADHIVGDHKIINEADQSKDRDRAALVLQDRATWWLQAYAAQTKSAPECIAALRRFVGPQGRAKLFYSDNSGELGAACEELGWVHDTSTPYRSESNGIAENAVKRVNEGTSCTLSQSGFSDPWWKEAMQTFCFLRCVVDQLVGGKTAYFLRFKVDYDGPTYPMGCHITYLPRNEAEKAKVHAVGGRRLQGIFVGYVQNAQGGFQGDLRFCDWDDIAEATHANNIFIKRTHADEILPVLDEKGDFMFPLVEGDLSQPGQKAQLVRKLSRRERKKREEKELKDREAEEDAEDEDDPNIPPRELLTDRGQPQNPPPDICVAESDFWTCNSSVLTRHHVKPRSKLFVPSMFDCPIPLKWLDVYRHTITNLPDVKEANVNDFWRDTKCPALSGLWTGRTVFDIIRPKPPDGYKYICGWRKTKIQKTTRPDSMIPEEFNRLSKKNKAKEIEKWKIEGPKLEAARTRAKVHFVPVAEVEEYEKTLAEAKAKFSIPDAPAMETVAYAMVTRRQAKEARRQKWEDLNNNLGQPTKSASSSSHIPSTSPPESRKRKWDDGINEMERTLKRCHDDKISGTSWGPLADFNETINGFALVHKQIDIKKAWGIPKAKAALDKEWGKLEKPGRPAWDLAGVRSRAEVEAEAINLKKTTHFGNVIELCSIKHYELKLEDPDYKGRVCFRGDVVKNEEGVHAVFSEQGTSSAHMASTKFLDVIARLPGNKGEDADAVGAYPQLLMSEAAELLGVDVIPETWVSLPTNHRPSKHFHPELMELWKGIKDPVCPMLRNLYGHPLAGLLWEKGSQKRIMSCGFERVKGWESLYVHREQQLFLGVYVDDFHMAGKADNLAPMWEKLGKVIDLDEPVSFDGNTYLGCQQENVIVPTEVIAAQTKQYYDILKHQKAKSGDSRIDELAASDTEDGHASMSSQTEVDESSRKRRMQKQTRATARQRNVKSKVTLDSAKSTKTQNEATAMNAKAKSDTLPVQGWRYKMSGAARSAVDRYLELSHLERKDLKKVATPCLEDNLIAPEDFLAKGHLSPVASKCVLKALYLARLSRPDLLWTVNALAREVTKWTVACDKRLHRLMCYINATENDVMTSFCGDKAADCKLMLYVDASFAGCINSSKSTTGALLCVVGPRTFCPITWICKKQGAVSHSSSEAEVIALDTGVRLEGIPSMDLWEEIINVFGDEPTVVPPKPDPHTGMLPTPPTVSNHLSDYLKSETELLSQVDFVPPNVPPPRGKAVLIICEDNEAVINMSRKARSPNMRHCPRVQRVDLDWLFDRLLKDTNIQIQYVNTKQQMADMFTKGSFTSSTWSSLCKLILIGQSFPLKPRNPNVHAVHAATGLQAPRCPLGLPVSPRA